MSASAEHPLESAYHALQDYVLSMRSGVGKKIATQGLVKMERQLERIRAKEQSGAQKAFDPEAITEQKRAWLEAQERARGQQQLVSWPQHLIEHFFVVGLPPDVEVTQIAGDLLEKERRQRDNAVHHVPQSLATTGGNPTAGKPSPRDPRSGSGGHEEWAAHDSVRMLRGSAGVATAPPLPHYNPTQPPPPPQQQQPQPRFDKVPSPAYPPQVLFHYPGSSQAPLRDREVCDLCFPHQVPPRRIRRSPSWSALNEVVLGHTSAKEDQAFVFMLKAGGNLPLYGICMYSEEVLHRPPALARERYSNCKAPYRQCLIAAPRCYCILSQYPFFPLHFQVLNIILSMERLHRIVEFSAEVSCSTAGAQDRTGPHGTAAANDEDVSSPTERVAVGDTAPLDSNLSSGQVPAHTPSLACQEWQRQCSDSMRQLALRIMNPQVTASDSSKMFERSSTDQSSLSRPSIGSLVAKSRPSEVWEGLALMLNIKHPEPELPPGSVPPLKIDAPLVMKPRPHGRTINSSLHHAEQEQRQQQQEQQEQSHRVSIVQQMLEDALMATATHEDELEGVGSAQGSHSSPFEAAPGPAFDASLTGQGSRRWASQGRAARKSSQLLSARSLGSDFSRPRQQRKAFASQRAVSVVDGKQLPHSQQLGDVLPTHKPSLRTAEASAQAGAAMDVGHFWLPGRTELTDRRGSSDEDNEEALSISSSRMSGCMSQSWPASSSWLPKPTTPNKPSQAHQRSGGVAHTRPVGFGTNQCVTQTCTPKAGVGPEPVGGGGLTQMHIPDIGSEAAWHAGGKPVRAFEGHDYERHLHHLLATQASPSDAQEPQQRQHLRELLNKQMDSPAAARHRPGMFDSCASAVGHAHATKDSAPGSSTCFASPEPKLSAHAATPRCPQEESHSSRVPQQHLPQSPPPSQQQPLLTIHQHLPSNSSSTHSMHFQDTCPAFTPDRTLSHAPSSPPMPHQQHKLQCSSSMMLDGQGCVTPLPAQTHSHPATATPDCKKQSSGSIHGFASPATAFPAGQEGVAGTATPEGGVLPSPLGPSSEGPSPTIEGLRAAQAPRPPLQGALTKRLQQASSHVPTTSNPATNTTTGSNSSAVAALQSDSRAYSRIARLRSPELLATHHHTRSGSAASFHTAIEGPEDARGVGGGAGTGGLDLLLADAADHDSCKDNKDDSSISGGPFSRNSDTSKEGHDCERPGSLLRLDTPPALPSSALPRRSNTARSGSSLASSMAGAEHQHRGSERGHHQRQRGAHGLDASQFSSLAVLDTLYHAPLVHPGDCLHFSLGGINTLAYWRPLLPRRAHILGPLHQLASYADEELATELSGWAAAALIRALPLEDLLLLLTAALLEQQLVFFCPNISLLSACVLGLLPLLRPYAWHGLLMPVTPASMACFLEAPVPFVLGWQYKTQDVSARCTSLVRVNVYKGNVSNAHHLPVLPGHKKLAAALAPHHARVRAAAAAAGRKPIHILTPEEEHATKDFLDVLSVHLGGGSSGRASPGTVGGSPNSSACLLGDLRPYFITNVSGSARTATLMKDWVLEATPSRDRPFVRAFLETQMFQVGERKGMAFLAWAR